LSFLRSENIFIANQTYISNKTIFCVWLYVWLVRSHTERGRRKKRQGKIGNWKLGVGEGDMSKQSDPRGEVL
jgi:hypothetical protein